MDKAKKEQIKHIKQSRPRPLMPRPSVFDNKRKKRKDRVAEHEMREFKDDNIKNWSDQQ